MFEMSERRGAGRAIVPVALAVAAIVTGMTMLQARGESRVAVPPPVADEAEGNATSEVAVVAGGCFWGVQGVFQHVNGVTSAVSGYAGGDKGTAEYHRVGTGMTGHAESVQITFDPRVITYGRLLQIYFSVAHDPTQVDRQGPDYGTQYRSALFPTSDEQARVAQTYIAQIDAAHIFGAKIATRVEPGRTFYPAEDYHQDYLAHNPMDMYIVVNDRPKIAALKKTFPDLYRDKPVLVGDRRR